MTPPIANFLQQRFDSGCIFAGPFALVTHRRRLSHRFAAVIRGERGFHFVVVLHKKALSLLPNVEQDFQNLLDSGEEWGIAPEDGRHPIQLRHSRRKPTGTGRNCADRGPSWLWHGVRKGASPQDNCPSSVAPRLRHDLATSLEDIAELDRFWSYLDSNRSTLGPMSMGMADLFGAFRDLAGIAGGRSRYPKLYQSRPALGLELAIPSTRGVFGRMRSPLFPDDTIAWKVEPPTDGIQRLISKASLSWCTVVAGCVLHFVFQFAEQHLDMINGRLLELIIHCLADSTSQRKTMIENLPVFAKKADRYGLLRKRGDLGHGRRQQ